MSLRSLVRKALRLAWLPIICTVIAGVVASAFVGESPTTYRSTLLLVIPSSQARPADSGVEGSSTTVDPIGRPTEALRLAGIYAELIPNDSQVLAAVAEAADLPVDDVRSNLTAVPLPDSSLIRLRYTAPTAEQSEAGITALEQALTSGAPSNDAISPGSLVLVSTDGPNATSGSSRFVVPSAMILGFVFGSFLAVVWSRTVPRIDDPSDVRDLVGAPVLSVQRSSSVPDYIGTLLKGAPKSPEGEPMVHLGLLGTSAGSGSAARALAKRLEDAKTAGDELDQLASVECGSIDELSGLGVVADSNIAVLVSDTGDRLDGFEHAMTSLTRAGIPLLGVLLIRRPILQAIPGWPRRRIDHGDVRRFDAADT